MQFLRTYLAVGIALKHIVRASIVLELHRYNSSIAGGKDDKAVNGDIGSTIQRHFPRTSRLEEAIISRSR